VALGLIGALVVYLLATAAPAPPPEARESVATTSPSSGQPSASTAPGNPSATAPSSSGSAAATAPPLETQMRYVEQAMRSPRPVQVRMIVTEGELNALLARESGSGDVQNPRVYFGNGTVVTTGQVTWQNRELWVTVRAHPVASGGRVELVVDEVSVGRMPAPAAMREQVGRRLNEDMSRLTGRGRLHVQSVQITAGRMTLTGQAGGGR
jgi:cytoskeletal protein RodZ